ncbi:MAG TPA: hypothetical protein VGK41_09930 [Solirubrobacterales bacterium]
MTTLTQPPTNPPPPPPPANPPTRGPSHPPDNRPPNRRPADYPKQLDGPTGPGRVVIAAEYLLAEPLNLLVTALLDADHDPAVRAHLNAAANHVSLALSRLARIDLPARQQTTRGLGPAGGLGSTSPSGPALGLAAAPPISGGGSDRSVDPVACAGAGGSRRQAPGATRGGEGGNFSLPRTPPVPQFQP